MKVMIDQGDIEEAVMAWAKRAYGEDFEYGALAFSQTRRKDEGQRVVASIEMVRAPSGTVSSAIGLASKTG